MIRFIFLLILIIPTICFSQSVLPLRADTVRIEKINGSAELHLRNATRDSLGVLTNIGNGRTRFLKSRKSGDTVFVGKDTIIVPQFTPTNFGSYYRLFVPPNKWRTLRSPSDWLVLDTAGTDEMRLIIAPQVGYGLNVDFFDVIHADTTELATQYDLTQISGGGSGGPDSTFYKLSWTDVEKFGAKPDGVEDSTGNITATSATFTSSTANFTAADIGKYIAVGGAGAAGAELITTISGFTNSTTVTLTASAGTTVTDARYRYGTNNTAAIQNAINSLADSSAGTLYFHPGKYFVTDPPVTDVDGYNPNSVLYIPHSPYAPSANQKSIRLLGSTPPNLFIDFASGQAAPDAGTVIMALRNDSAASLLGTVADTALYGIFNWRMCYLENLTLRTKSDDQVTDKKALMSGINFGRQNFVVMNNVRVQTTSATENSVKPDSLSYGIYLPIVNNGGNNHVENVLVQGYGIGFKVSENTYGNKLTISSCNIALQIDSSLHALEFGRILTTWCPTKLKVTGTSYFSIKQYDIEHYSIGSYWFNDVVDLDERLAYNSIGDITYFIQLAYGGQSINTFTRTGNYMTSGIKANPIGGVVSHNFVNATNQEVRIGSMKGADGSFMLITDGTGQTSNNLAFGGVKKRSFGIGLAGTGINDHFTYNVATGRVNQYIDVDDNQYFGGAQAHITPQLSLLRADSSAIFAGQATFNAGSMIFTRQSGTFPTFYYGNLAGASNAKWADWYNSGTVISHRWLTDALAGPVEFFKATRGGDVEFPSGNVATAGNLSIGSTTTTDARLKVENNTNAANLTLFKNTDAGSGASVMNQFQNNAGSVYMYLSSSTSALSNEFLIQQTIGNIRMYTGAGEVVRITSGGKFRITATPDSGAATGGYLYRDFATGDVRLGPGASGADGNGIYTGNGSLSGSTTITGAGNTLTMTGTQSSLYAFNVTNTGNGGAGSFATNGTGSALTGANSSSGNGVLATSSSGNGISATSVSSIAGRFKITPTSTNTVVHVFRTIRGSSNTMAAGGGGGWDMQVTDDAGNDVSGASIAPVLTSAATGATTTDIQMETTNSGSKTLKFTLKGNGQQRLHAYTTGAFAGTPTDVLASDASGNVVQATPTQLNALMAMSVVAADPDNWNAAVSTFTTLPSLAGAGGSKTVTLPSAASNTGKTIILHNVNADANLWSFAAAITLANGTTTTTFGNQTLKTLLSNGSVWIQISSQ